MCEGFLSWWLHGNVVRVAMPTRTAVDAFADVAAREPLEENQAGRIRRCQALTSTLYFVSWSYMQ